MWWWFVPWTIGVRIVAVGTGVRMGVRVLSCIGSMMSIVFGVGWWIIRRCPTVVGRTVGMMVAWWS